jgi:hypothetical protein
VICCLYCHIVFVSDKFDYTSSKYPTFLEHINNAKRALYVTGQITRSTGKDDGLSDERLLCFMRIENVGLLVRFVFLYQYILLLFF